ncbi:hypothetical protein [Streptosporangium sp. NPDC049078]|uniref:hypothetical protein n=1 Tax=Streptosporangium sp. NPDC049078 TaxID=3155767 RepID=UPI003446DF5C
MRAESMSAGQPPEIACDESGPEGENLIGENTDVFTHAGLCLDVESAAGRIREIQKMAPSPAVEYKADLLLREKNRPARYRNGAEDSVGRAQRPG